MTHRILRILGGAVLVLALPLSAYANFPDVAPTYPYADALQYMQDMGYMGGYADGSVHAEDTVNRAEFLKVVISSQYDAATIGACISQYTQRSWTYVWWRDVAVDSWYAPYACMGKMQHIVDGYADRTLHPEDTLTIAEAAKMLALAYTLPIEPNDIWYVPYMDALQAQHAIPPSVTDTAKLITRGELAEMVYVLKNPTTAANTTLYGPYDEILGPVVRGTNTAFSYRMGEKWYIQVNAKNYGPYESADIPQVTAAGYAVGYVDKNKWYAVIKNKTYGPYDDGLTPAVASDGSSAYLAQTDGDWYAYILGEKVGPFPSPLKIAVSQKGWMVWYVQDGKLMISVNGTVAGPFDYDATKVFVPDAVLTAKHTGYWYTREGKQWATVDGEEYGPYTGGHFVPSTDEHWALVGTQNGQAVLQTADGVVGPYDTISNPVRVMPHWAFLYIEDGVPRVFARDSQYCASGFARHAADLEKRLPGEAPTPNTWTRAQCTVDTSAATKNKLLAPEDVWGYSYTKGGKAYVHIAGTEYGPYESAYAPSDIGKNYWYATTSQKGSVTFSLAGVTYGPYDDGVGPVEGDTVWAIGYKDDDMKWYVRIGKKE